jgi:Na+/H+ antiporter NhaD/arsenite permease-like protein
LPFLLVCGGPVALSLVALYFLVAPRLRGGAETRDVRDDRDGRDIPEAAEAIPLHRWQATKAVLLTLAAIALFLSPVPAPLTALAIAGLVLASRRMETRAMLAEVDWSLLALFVGLFVVGRGFEVSGWTEAARHAFAAAGADLSHPAVLMAAVAVLSLAVGNVPAVMLLLPFVARQPSTGYAMALASTFAGNAVLVGSIANLIVAEQAAKLGIRFGLREQIGVGLPLTLISLALAAALLLLPRL